MASSLQTEAQPSRTDIILLQCSAPTVLMMFMYVVFALFSASLQTDKGWVTAPTSIPTPRKTPSTHSTVPYSSKLQPFGVRVEGVEQRWSGEFVLNFWRHGYCKSPVTPLTFFCEVYLQLPRGRGDGCCYQKSDPCIPSPAPLPLIHIKLTDESGRGFIGGV